MWPGNTADVTTVIPVIDRLRRRFDIARVCVVVDRGMISAETMAELEGRQLLYILGVRERSDKLVRELVLADTAPFVPLVMKKRGKEIDYEAKTVMLAGRRYIVCRNRQEAEKDAADRASIVTALARQLAKGDKALTSTARRTSRASPITASAGEIAVSVFGFAGRCETPTYRFPAIFRRRPRRPHRPPAAWPRNRRWCAPGPP
jgi:transposase